MDHIPFKKMSEEEAKKSLQRDVVKTDAKPPLDKDWQLNRLPADCQSEDLAAPTFKWLATIPKEIRPDALAHQFPRIANRLAEIWKRPLQCERYLDDLTIDRRGGRKGFPPDVAAEITALKAYFLRSTKTVRFGIWGNRTGID